MLNVAETVARDVKAIIQERFKIAVGKHWMKEEG